MKKTILITALFICSISGFSVTWTITNGSFVFNPASISIHSGDSVRFSLASIHNVVEVSQATWNTNGSSALPGGFSLPFGGGLVLPSQLGVGVHYYVCQHHASSGMKGKITVTSTSVQTLFQKDYGTSDNLSDASGACIQQTSDGGYITAGYISNFGAGQDDIYLIKTNTDGDTLWTKSYGSINADDANYVAQTSDGGYAIAGVTHSFGGENISLIKTDASGGITWSKIYGTGDTLSDASAASAQQTSDNGFILAGYISNYGAGQDDYYLVKTDANGAIQWTKTYGGTDFDDANSVEQTADGGYIIAGMTSSFGDPIGDVYLVKTNSTGDTLWTRTYASNLTDGMDMANSVRQTNDHGYIIAGVTISASQGEFALLIKTDSSGNIQWTKFFGTNDNSSDASFSSVKQTTDGGYIATGYISNFGGGGDDYYLVKTNSSGDTLWTRTYGSSNNDDANFIIQTGDGGYMMGGSTLGFSGGEHLYLVKTDTSGNSTCNEYRTQTITNTSRSILSHHTATQVSTGGVASNAVMTVRSGGVAKDVCSPSVIHEKVIGNNQIIVFPNPSSSRVTFVSGNDLKNAVLKIYNVNGQEVKQLIFSGKQVVLERGDLLPGIYFYRLQSGSELMGSGKLIIE